MNINIRRENPGDYRQVEHITREAFWNLYRPGCDEHYMAHHLRNHEDFIPELTFVIELDGQIVGSIFYSKSKVVADDGRQWETITFGPVSISPELHRQGLGRKLITHSIEQAKKLGYRAIMIGGFTYHYHPYGFVGTKKYSITMPDGKYYTGIMALPLYDGALDGVRGKLHFSEGMYPDEAGFEEYDKAFPEKEKLVLSHQANFETAAAEIDTQDYE
ncbi:N-acetyltransferase [Tyzzerella sp. OttesenSCG-928-J15]|nr:N-acetyltransferase [Ruminococcaceae bacterium OttesenSCG-928-L11]MDL2248706.1 N-acetyltransferase [Tyzzerella sp. OttesenSCG-928-J15]